MRTATHQLQHRAIRTCMDLLIEKGEPIAKAHEFAERNWQKECPGESFFDEPTTESHIGLCLDWRKRIGA